MKTQKGFLRALRLTPIYAGEFGTRADVFREFDKTDDSDIQILYAVYNTGSYEGDAIVIYYRKSTKKYYEAYGSHCSCYGLEDQWDRDEEIVADELLGRVGELGSMYQGYLKG